MLIISLQATLKIAYYNGVRWYTILVHLPHILLGHQWDTNESSMSNQFIILICDILNMHPQNCNLQQRCIYLLLHNHQFISTYNFIIIIIHHFIVSSIHHHLSTTKSTYYSISFINNSIYYSISIFIVKFQPLPIIMSLNFLNWFPQIGFVRISTGISSVGQCLNSTPLSHECLQFSLS